MTRYPGIVPDGATVLVKPVAPAGSTLTDVEEMDCGCPTMRVPGMVPLGGTVEVKALAPGGIAWIDVVENGRGTPTWT